VNLLETIFGERVIVKQKLLFGVAGWNITETIRKRINKRSSATLYSLTSEDIPKAVETLIDAFNKAPLLEAVLKEDSDQDQVLTALLTFLYCNYCFIFEAFSIKARRALRFSANCSGE